MTVVPRALLCVVLTTICLLTWAATGHAAGFAPPVTVDGWTAGSNWPQVVSAAPGSAIAYWDAYPPTPWEGQPHPQVRAQVITASGALEAHALDTDAYNATAASDGLGRASIAWTRSDGYLETQIRLADYDPATGFGPIQVIDARNGPVAVARNDRGDTLVAYEGQNGTYGNVFARFRPAGADGFQPPVVISSVPSILYARPSVSLAPDGSAAIAWMDWPDTARDTQRALVAQRSAGGTWSGPTVLSGAGHIGEWPAVAAGPGGGTVAAWREHDGRPEDFWTGPSIVFAAVRPAGGDWAPAQQIARTASNQSRPAAVAADGDEGVVVTQQEPGEPVFEPGRAVRTFTADLATGRLSAPATIDARNAYGFGFAMNRAGHGVLVQSDGCSPCGVFRAAPRDRGDATFAAPAPVTCPAPWPADVLGVDVDGLGQAAVLWHDYTERPGQSLQSNSPSLSLQDVALPDLACEPVPYEPAWLPSWTPPPTAPPATTAPDLAFPVTGATLSHDATDLALAVTCPATCRLRAESRVARTAGLRAAITARGTGRASKRRAVVHLKLRRRDGAALARALRRRAAVKAAVRVTGRAEGRAATTASVVRVRRAR